MLTRQEIEKREEKTLAPYAMKSKKTRGRVYPEKEHEYRSVYQRDRDRIIHSTAFRRLEYKTQVFVNHEGDYYRTRLTHTLEVSQIARSIAKALKLNEELVETIALAHDLGHTPFGHSGEEALHEIMKEHGGFEHNRQGLRVVDILEQRYPEFPGLNLSWEVREGIIKHQTSFDQPEPTGFEPDKQPYLEAQVVDAADEIAYDNHDLDDGLTAGLIKEEELRNIELWAKAKQQAGAIFKGKMNKEIRKYQIVRSLINLEVTELIKQSENNIKRLKISSCAGVREAKKRIISFSPGKKKKMEELRDFLLKNLYRHYRVVRMSNKARRFIKELFAVYLSSPDQLPPTSYQRLKNEDKRRVICDYVAGMTDRYCLDEYKKLFEPYERV